MTYGVADPRDIEVLAAAGIDLNEYLFTEDGPAILIEVTVGGAIDSEFTVKLDAPVQSIVDTLFESIEKEAAPEEVTVWAVTTWSGPDAFTDADNIYGRRSGGEADAAGAGA